MIVFIAVIDSVKFLVLRTYRRPCLGIWLEVCSLHVMASLSKYINGFYVKVLWCIFAPKTFPKPSENQSKIDARGLLEPILGSLGQHLGHISPEDWILEAFGRVLEAQDVQLGSNLEAPDP